jgi:RNA polymerase sigma-70 factor (ECF subfamily)
VRRDLDRASDAELLRLADGEAFTELYDRHVEAIFCWARVRAGDHAADLTAEVFARAWLCRRRFRDRGHGSALPWLYGVAGNVLRDSLRKQAVEQRARARMGLPLAVAPDPAYEAVDDRLSLPETALRLLRELPQEEQELLRLRIVDGWRYDRIAGRLRCTPELARTRVSRALRRLQLALGGPQT